MIVTIRRCPVSSEPSAARIIDQPIHPSRPRPQCVGDEPRWSSFLDLTGPDEYVLAPVPRICPARWADGQALVLWSPSLRRPGIEASMPAVTVYMAGAPRQRPDWCDQTLRGCIRTRVWSLSTSACGFSAAGPGGRDACTILASDRPASHASCALKQAYDRTADD